MTFRDDSVDIERAHAFLYVLAWGERVTLQTFDDRYNRQDRRLTRVLQGALDEHSQPLVNLNRHGAGVYVMVNEGDLRGRETKNVIRVRAVFVDLDGAPLDRVLKGPLPPHLVVSSSRGRFHTYWLVDGLPLKAFKPAQKALAAYYGGDPSVCDLPRVMRLPGFFHQKAEPVLVKFAHTTSRPPYTCSELFKAFPSIAEAIKRTQDVSQKTAESHPFRHSYPDAAQHILNMSHRKLERIASEGQSRHRTLLWAALSAREHDLGEEEACRLGLEIAHLLPTRDGAPVPASEVMGVVRWVYANVPAGETSTSKRVPAPGALRRRHVFVRLRRWQRLG